MTEDQTFFLQKVAQFTNIALNEIEALEDRVIQLRKKEAAEKHTAIEKQAKLEFALEKAARALYESDFLTDDFEKRKFLKLAKEDPSYLADVLERVCKAADVSLIGIPARVAAKNKNAEYDPVAAKAFGWGRDQTTFEELD
jgi:hypothetical protein